MNSETPNPGRGWEKTGDMWVRDWVDYRCTARETNHGWIVECKHRPPRGRAARVVMYRVGTEVVASVDDVHDTAQCMVTCDGWRVARESRAQTPRSAR
jgi:hypothetical protein